MSSTTKTFDIRDAAVTVHRAARYFPAGTVFLVVVNPGGLNRDAIVLRTKDPEYFFVGYHNGSLDIVAEEFGIAEVRTVSSYEAVENPLFGPLWLSPVAAALTTPRDQQPAQFQSVGTHSGGIPHTWAARRRRQLHKELVGEIDQIDSYGNATTNIRYAMMEQAGIHLRQSVQVRLSRSDKQIRPWSSKLMEWLRGTKWW